MSTIFAVLHLREQNPRASESRSELGFRKIILGSRERTDMKEVTFTTPLLLYMLKCGIT